MVVENNSNSVDVLVTYHRLMGNMRNQIVKLVADEESEIINKHLRAIADYEAEIERYLREEAFASLGTYHQTINSVVIEAIPQGISFEPLHGGIDICGIPMWMIGYTGRKIPSSSHGGRPFIRTVPLWNYLVRHLKTSYLSRTPRSDVMLTERPPQDANVTAVFHVKNRNIRDLDHYDFGPLLNACVGNGLLMSDHPASLSVTLKWVPADTNTIDFFIRYEPLTQGSSL